MGQVGIHKKQLLRECYDEGVESVSLFEGEQLYCHILKSHSPSPAAPSSRCRYKKITDIYKYNVQLCGYNKAKY